MTCTAVIVDTSVIVAGLLTENDASPVARILDGMLVAAFPFVVSETLVDEYRTVLVQPKLRKLHGLTIAEVDTVLTDLVQHAIVSSAPPLAALPAPDPGDQFLRDLLAARSHLRLVTGDKLLLQSSGMRGRVITPQVFVAGIDPGRLRR